MLIAQMHETETIILEEPKTTGFIEMLRGDVPVEAYLLQVDASFPLFSKNLCLALKKLFVQGKRIVQVEPYLDCLVKIHEFFAAGKAPGYAHLLGWASGCLSRRKRGHK